MNVTVVGTGYVGLVTGCCLAEAGHQVVCVDNNQQKVADLKKGLVPIFEPGLEEVMQSNIKQAQLFFTTDLAEGVKDAEAIFLALPTPPQEDGSADLSAVLAVAKQLSDCLPAHYCVVIDKSTVPVGTAGAVRQAIANKATTEFDVVSNPEFLREGFAVKDFMEPERVVVGVTSDKAEMVMRKLYASFVNEGRPLYITDPATAELTKYAANTFLVTKISFMNEIAQLCERMGADVEVLRQAIGADSRIGHKFLYPGIGSGGSCFPKDVRALKHMSQEHNYDFKLIQAAMSVNENQPLVLTEKINQHFKDDVKGKTFALWGLAFKPNTDDIRDAPALVIIEELLKAGASVTAYDPEAGEHVRQRYADNPKLTIVSDKYEALKGASALLIATEWQEFRDSDPRQIADGLNQPLIFDGRNIFKTDDVQAAGFTYYSIGRKPVVQ
ncbi:UDP-glucose 6-dehydrogenase [Candidatus Saccharibacteria bacterium CG_4_10_14_0_2_um_filter_52_9]|nr:MAG: UDP-glucose 6-dehydrogenase [Candidatus Saccharibacteria bacterium CG_4_10_14_0_2_um_filter_52_9]